MTLLGSRLLKDLDKVVWMGQITLRPRFSMLKSISSDTHRLTTRLVLSA